MKSPKTMRAAETISDLELENCELRKEISKLSQMLKQGFEGDGLCRDKIIKIFAKRDENEIKKLYNEIGGIITTIKLIQEDGPLSRFLRVNYNTRFECNYVPTFTNDKKKFVKFKDNYDSYFLEPVGTPEMAFEKIRKAIESNSKEYTEQKEIIKSEVETLSNNIEETSEILKTITKILTKSKTQEKEISEVTDILQEKLQIQETAIDILVQ